MTFGKTPPILSVSRGPLQSPNFTHPRLVEELPAGKMGCWGTTVTHIESGDQHALEEMDLQSAEDRRGHQLRPVCGDGDCSSTQLNKMHA